MNNSLGRDEKGFPLHGVDQVPVREPVALLRSMIEQKEVEIARLKQQLLKKQELMEHSRVIP